MAVWGGNYLQPSGETTIRIQKSVNDKDWDQIYALFNKGNCMTPVPTDIPKDLRDKINILEDIKYNEFQHAFLKLCTEPKYGHACSEEIEKWNTWREQNNCGSILLELAWLWGGKLQGAKLQEACLTGADLRGANLKEAELEKARLQGTNITSAKLQGAWLQRADLQNVKLKQADLQGTQLDGANLQGAELHSTNLHMAQFWYANLQEVDFSNANLQMAWFMNTRIQKAKKLSPRQLSEVWVLYGAKLDPELENEFRNIYPERSRHLLDEVPDRDEWKKYRDRLINELGIREK